jgi:hypothetical protein
MTLKRDFRLCKSLEHLHIIQLGNKIRSRTTQRHYDEDIINATTPIIVKDVPDQFGDENQYHNAFFDILVSSGTITSLPLKDIAYATSYVSI